VVCKFFPRRGSHFSNNSYTDLLFYSPSEGTGEFYSRNATLFETELKLYRGTRRSLAKLLSAATLALTCGATQT
jgi:hypothetical protein